MDINLPLFSTNGLTTSVPYQSGAFAFDPVSVNPYNMQQASYYSPNIPHSMSYTASPDVQSLPTVRDARNVFNAMVKSESTSPIQSNPMYNDTSYATECKRSTSEPTEGSNTNFATDVDTLMRAIQAKQTNSPQSLEPKVRYSMPHLSFCIFNLKQEEEIKVTQKPRKRYQCTVPNCNKSFYQKTHLEIHIRAHTGAKPFVSFLLRQ
jgi:hypothetical protein